MRVILIWLLILGLLAGVIAMQAPPRQPPFKSWDEVAIFRGKLLAFENGLSSFEAVHPNGVVEFRELNYSGRTILTDGRNRRAMYFVERKFYLVLYVKTTKHILMAIREDDE